MVLTWMSIRSWAPWRNPRGRTNGTGLGEANLSFIFSISTFVMNSKSLPSRVTGVFPVLATSRSCAEAPSRADAKSLSGITST